jgi:hypothetical protein
MGLESSFCGPQGSFAAFSVAQDAPSGGTVEGTVINSVTELVSAERRWFWPAIGPAGTRLRRTPRVWPSAYIPTLWRRWLLPMGRAALRCTISGRDPTR